MNGRNKKTIYKNFIKRSMDFILSLIILIVLSPIFILLVLIVRFKLGSPVIFKQERPGLKEKTFTIYKFRTMTDERDNKGVLLHDSKRLTKFGKLLRKTSLDELPELINIVKGDMSLVGPRPLLTRYLPYYNEEERVRHSVRPGLTGLSQINGRNNLGWNDRLAKDVEYTNNISFLGDIKILSQTVIKVLKRSDIATGEELIIRSLDIERNQRSHKNYRT